MVHIFSLKHIGRSTSQASHRFGLRISGLKLKKKCNKIVLSARKVLEPSGHWVKAWLDPAGEALSCNHGRFEDGQTAVKSDVGADDHGKGLGDVLIQFLSIFTSPALL